MGLVLIIIGISIGFYREKIRGVESYAISIENPSINYDLTNDKTAKKIYYRPNVHSFTGLSINTPSLGGAITTQNKDQEKLHTKASNLMDLQLFGQFKNHIWEAYYQNYQGLYITDSETVSPNLSSANSWSYGLSVKRFTKKEFSLNKSFAYFSKNKVSGWSPVVGLSINKSNIFRKDGLIPIKFQNDFVQLKDIKAIEMSNIASEVGITGLYQYKKFFIGTLISLGLQLQKQEYTGIDSGSRTIISASNAVFVDLGHETKMNGTFGLSARSYGTGIPIKDSYLQLNRNSTAFYYKYFF